MNLNLSINHFFRYEYVGLLTLFYTELYFRNIGSKFLISEFNPAFIVLLALIIGAPIYFFYKILISEIVIAQMLIHPRKSVPAELSMNVFHYIQKKYKIKPLYSEDALRLVRTTFKHKMQSGFHLQHSEIHMCYLTAVISIFFGSLLLNQHYEFIIVMTGVVFFLIGWLADIHLCRIECDYLIQQDESEIRSILGQFRKANLNKEVNMSCNPKESKCGCGCIAYMLGIIGAAVYYISAATGFWTGAVGLLKSLVWPAFLVSGLLKSLGA